MGKVFVGLAAIIGLWFLLGSFPSLHSTFFIVSNYAITWFQSLFAVAALLVVAVLVKL